MSNRDKNPQVYIRGFSKHTVRGDINDAFKKYGKIQDVQIFKQSYAFVTFYDYKDADDAVAGMHRQYLTKYDDYRLTVEHSGGGKKRERSDGPRGPQKDDVCFYCQEKGHWKNQCKEYYNQRNRYRRSSSSSGSRSSSSSSSSRSRSRSKRRKSSRSRRRRKYSSSSSRSSSSRSRSRSRSDHKSKKNKRYRSDSRSSKASDSRKSSRDRSGSDSRSKSRSGSKSHSNERKKRK